VERYLGIGRRHADDHRRIPGPRGVERRADEFGPADDLERHVDAPTAGQCPQYQHDRRPG